MVIWEEEDNIAIDSYIIFVIYKDIPRTRLAKKNNSASETEVYLEPVSELSYGEREGAEVVEAEALNFISEFKSNEGYGTFKSP